MNITNKGAVTSIYFTVSGGWEQWICLMSDNHDDSIYCNRKVEDAHFKKAKDLGALILITGDYFDAMQGRVDPRRSMEDLRPEYRVNNYYDFVVEEAVRRLTPYKDNLILLADGGHELSVLKFANTNLCDRTAAGLRELGSPVIHGGFGGWVRFLFNRGNNPQGSINLKYNHGAGSNAPVTRGTIQTNRQAVFLPDADIVHNGHNHQGYYVPITRERIGGKGAQFFDIQHHVRTPGYKMGYGDGSKSWEAQNGFPPNPIGCCFIKILWMNNKPEVSVHPEIVGGGPV